MDISNIDVKRFWNKINKMGEDECWEWKGGKEPTTGSGMFYYNKKQIFAHRLVYILTYGDIENIKNQDIIYHTCFNNSCCNPNHLLIKKDWNKILFDDVLINKFWANVDKKGEEDCWMWKGPKRDRYGIIGYKYYDYRAHRLSYMLANNLNSLPDGMCVCHKCDHPFCVNPDHLFLGTQLDNIADMVQKNRAYHHKGEVNGNSKLKNEDIYNIREMYADHLYTHKELANIFGISETMIGLITRGIYWKEIGGRIRNRDKKENQ